MATNPALKAILATCILAAAGPAGRAPAGEVLTYAVAAQGKIVGYKEFRILSAAEGKTAGKSGPGEGLSRLETELFVKLTLLGQDADIKITETFLVDPGTRRVVSYEGAVTRGGSVMRTTADLAETEARFEVEGAGPVRVTPLTPETLLPAGLDFSFLLRGRAGKEGGGTTFALYDFTDGGIHEAVFERTGEERLALAGRDREAVVFDWADKTTGARRRLWIDAGSGRMVREVLPNKSILFLADPAVTGQIRRAGGEEAAFATVAEDIRDFKDLKTMKVEAKISGGRDVTIFGLDRPGQKFRGTVTNGAVEGLFETASRRYDGEGAPPFPCAFDRTGHLGKDLAAEEGIEAGDPVLAGEAARITRGAADAWDAARRLSRWVAKAIAPAAAGGSARAAYDARKGNSAAQSRLLCALCRAAGIPARPAGGCAYVPVFGGAFFSHVWTEVYMGDGGWTAVDPALGETDYIDAGHISVGSTGGGRPEKITILDYRDAPLRSLEKQSFASLPWKEGFIYTYTYVYDGKFMGTDSFMVSRRTGKDGKKIYHCTTRLDLFDRKSEGEWEMTGSGRPLSFRLKGRTGEKDYSMECDFLTDRVLVRSKEGDKEDNRAVPWKGKSFLLDNINISFFAVLFASLPLAEGKTWNLEVFHATSRGVFPLKVSVTGRKPGRWVLEANLLTIKLEFLVDDRGRLVKESGSKGKMVIELVP